MRFRDRREAGKALAKELGKYANLGDVLILALPRGGVPVAFEVATALRAPLDVFVVRKLGLPGHEELAMGAIASGGVRVINEDVVRYLHIPESIIDAVAAIEERELERREGMYREGRSALAVGGRKVILIDDGLATGSTMRVAVQSLRQRHPARIVVAVPVAPPSTCEYFRHEVGECVCVLEPAMLDGVSRWYEDFSQTTDEEVSELLEQAREAEQAAFSAR